MTSAQRYPVPAGRHRVEESIRRSRFITTVARATGAEAAHAFVQSIRDEFPDATHHCWAYVATAPGSTSDVGMSDDGEPHGTAGRPMLEVLLHSGVGEIVAVATRYYGGVKLGKGGLQRAYAGGVRLALESLPRAERVRRVRVVVAVEYAARDAVFRAAEELDAVMEDEEYGADVRLRVAVPESALGDFRRLVAEVTSGRGRIEPAG
ncbi:MAG: YigZ family protein [Gemmatimonadota bacterium]